MGVCKSNCGNGEIYMPIIFVFLFISIFFGADSRTYKKHRLNVDVMSKHNEVNSPRRTPLDAGNQNHKTIRKKPVSLRFNISPQNLNAKTQQEVTQILGVRVDPAMQSNQNQLSVHIDPSKPITQDMMFKKQPPYKKVLTPKRPKPKPQVYIAPQPPIDEYEGEDIEPLFIRNRNGVMVGVGIGASLDRLWVITSGGNNKFYDSAFLYYLRLGYQYYFTDYLGVRAYAFIGDWSNTFRETFFDGNKNVISQAELSFKYSFFAEVLYDFVVLHNHSFGIFAGFGLGVSYGSFRGDDTNKLEDYYAMPAFSVGFAYTLYENNRFEFESKIPLRTEVLKQFWRSELSTWSISLSYTYIF